MSEDILNDSSKWFDFGALPASPDWQLFTSGAINGRLFELQFILDWNAWNSPENLKFKSYCLLRFYYRKNGIFSVTEGVRRFYLQPQSRIFTWTIPPALQSSTYVMRVPGFRYQTFKSGAMQTPEAVFPWQLRLRYLVE